MTAEAAWGLYIHIPYCRSKCGYCDFTSYTDAWGTLPAYLDALPREAARYAGCAVDTVYIGGGTPSCLRLGDIARLMEAMRQVFRIAEDAEISIEANPNSLDDEKAREFFGAGINRLSLGLQATQGELLRKIGRTHTYADFLRALEAAQAAGFSNISADLMYSLPTQSVAAAEESAEKLSALPVTHISAYALRLERGTPLFGAPQPDDDTDRAMFYAMMARFREAGFARYEISNFAKKGYACRHNLKYWRGEEYVGLGVAAHSCFQGVRYGNTASIENYLSKVAAGVSATVQREAAEPVTEALMLKTRLVEGIPLGELPRGRRAGSFLQKLLQTGYARVQDGAFCLTDHGMDLHNSIVVELLEYAEQAPDENFSDGNFGQKHCESPSCRV